MKNKAFLIDSIIFLIYLIISVLMIFNLFGTSINIFLDMIYNIIFGLLLVLSLYILFKKKFIIKEKESWLSLMYIVISISSRVVIAIIYSMNMSNFD